MLKNHSELMGSRKCLNCNSTFLNYYNLFKKSIYASNEPNTTLQMRPDET